MSNRFAAWFLRVDVPDLDNFPNPDSCVPGMSPSEEEPGEGLPFDFPRDFFSDEQLVILDEYYHLKRDEVLQKFFDLLRLHPNRDELTLGNIVLNAGILAKVLGIGDYQSYSDKALYEAMGISKTAFFVHKRAILDALNDIKKI